MGASGGTLEGPHQASSMRSMDAPASMPMRMASPVFALFAELHAVQAGSGDPLLLIYAILKTFLYQTCFQKLRDFVQRLPGLRQC